MIQTFKITFAVVHLKQNTVVWSNSLGSGELGKRIYLKEIFVYFTFEKYLRIFFSLNIQSRTKKIGMLVYLQMEDHSGF